MLHKRGYGSRDIHATGLFSEAQTHALSLWYLGFDSTDIGKKLGVPEATIYAWMPLLRGRMRAFRLGSPLPPRVADLTDRYTRN